MFVFLQFKYYVLFSAFIQVLFRMNCLEFITETSFSIRVGKLRTSLGVPRIICLAVLDGISSHSMAIGSSYVSFNECIWLWVKIWRYAWYCHNSNSTSSSLKVVCDVNPKMVCLMECLWVVIRILKWLLHFPMLLVWKNEHMWCSTSADFFHTTIKETRKRSSLGKLDDVASVNVNYQDNMLYEKIFKSHSHIVI